MKSNTEHIDKYFTYEVTLLIWDRHNTFHETLVKYTPKCIIIDPRVTYKYFNG